MQFCVLLEKIDKRIDAKGKHLAFTYVTKNNEQEAIFVGADECFYFFFWFLICCERWSSALMLEL